MKAGNEGQGTRGRASGAHGEKEGPSLSDRERIFWMGRVQGQIRLLVAYGPGAFFVAESFNPDFWRPHIESRALPVHLAVGMFGLMWFVQALVIHRQLRSARGRIGWI
jgi:hypothetical protein